MRRESPLPEALTAKPEQIDWLSLKNNEAIQTTLESILAEACQALPVEVSSEGAETVLKEAILAKGCPYGIKIWISEPGMNGKRTAKGITNSPFDGSIIYF